MGEDIVEWTNLFLPIFEQPPAAVARTPRFTRCPVPHHDERRLAVQHC